MRKRIHAYDYIRIVAMLMVVGVHSIPSGGGHLGVWYTCFMNALLFPCNAIFFMLSGRLNIRPISDDKLPRYYYRKVVGVLMPALVYMLLLTLYQNRGDLELASVPVLARIYVINVIDKYSSNVHWFLFRLFGYLMAAPLIAPMVTEMTPRRKRAFIVIMLLFSAPDILLSKTSHTFDWSYPLGTFFGCFILGALLDLDRLADIAWWKTAFVTFSCVIVSMLLIAYGYPHHPVNDNTPMYFIAAVGMLVLLYGLGRKLPESRIVGFVARHSFGVYLCHKPIVRLVMRHLTIGPKPVAHLLVTLGTAACALCFAAIVDTVIVKPIAALCDYGWNARHAEEPQGS